MRFVWLICFVIFIQSAEAQDFCKQIKKEVSEDKTGYDFTSPFDPADPPAARVNRSYTTNHEFPYDNFIVTFQIPTGLDSVYVKSEDGTQTEKDEHNTVIEFEDHSKLTDDTTKIIHDLTEDRSQAVRILYYPLNANTVNDFATKKIIKFSLAGHEAMIPASEANALMHYIICIRAVKTF